MESQQVWTAFALTLIAGLSTGIGGLITIFVKKTNNMFLCASLSFSAGVMIYISFMEMVPEARRQLFDASGNVWGSFYLIASFFLGMALIALIDMLIPQPYILEETESVSKPSNKASIQRMGMLVAISISIHNFPEGIATFATALGDMSIAIPITVAIAIHNIPEGIAVAVPIYHATGSKSKAFWMSLLSGLTEPLGALIAFMFLMPFWSDLVSGCVLSAVSGIMVFISIDELLPNAQKYGKHSVYISGLVFGMVVMALSLFLFEMNK